MPKLTALSPINHDGKVYDEGDTLDVSDARQVEALVSAGAAVVQRASKAKAAPLAPAPVAPEPDAPAPDAEAATGADLPPPADTQA